MNPNWPDKPVEARIREEKALGASGLPLHPRALLARDREHLFVRIEADDCAAGAHVLFRGAGDDKGNFGYNAQTDSYGDMMEMV